MVVSIDCDDVMDDAVVGCDVVMDDDAVVGCVVVTDDGAVVVVVSIDCDDVTNDGVVVVGCDNATDVVSINPRDIVNVLGAAVGAALDPVIKNHA